MNPKQVHFNQLAAAWDTLPAPADAATRVRRFVDSVDAPGSRCILDVGCGTGILVDPLLEVYSAASCLVELDFAIEMLTEGRRKRLSPRIHHVCADARSLPFSQACFDLVLCFGVLPHLGDAATVIKELLRVLEPAGVLAVGHIMGSKELNALHRGLGGLIADDTLPPGHELARLLAAQGASVQRVEDKPEEYFVKVQRVPS